MTQTEYEYEQEVRCPFGPHHHLLLKLITKDRKPAITDGNLLEVGCHECKRRMRSSDPDISLVTHRFDLQGSLVETEVTHADGRSEIR